MFLGIASGRFPEFDGIAFGVVGAGEEAVRIGIIGVEFHGDAGVAELLDHGVEIGDAKIDHPLAVWVAEIVSVFRKRRPSGCARLLPPPGLLVIFGDKIDSQVFAIPEGECDRIPGAKEDAADAGYFFHETPAYIKKRLHFRLVGVLTLALRGPRGNDSDGTRIGDGLAKMLAEM